MVFIKRRRGQAFETMMLVISVIVAIAILGILLGFLQNINPFGQDAKTVMKSLLKDVSNRGVGLAKQENVQFDNVPIYKNEIIGDLSVSTMNFTCATGSADFCSGTSGPMDVSANMVTVTKKTTGSIVVCTKDGSEYHIVIANRGKTALEDAISQAQSQAYCDLA